MARESEIREGELAVDMPAARDAGLVFIGRIRTPWTSREMTPRQGRHDGPVCRLEIFEPWVPALKGVDFYSNLEVIYWLHLSRRDLVLQSPKNNKSTRGTFSLRSPVRPNPIGTSMVRLAGIARLRCVDCDFPGTDFTLANHRFNLHAGTSLPKPPLPGKHHHFAADDADQCRPPRREETGGSGGERRVT